MWSYQHPDELYHHGIKGMKWGVRRYQKKDGTLTSAGKKRYFEKSDGLYSKSKPPKNAMDGDGMSSKAKKFPGAISNVVSSKKQKRQNYPNKENEYEKERKRQQKHIATKRAIDIGSRFINSYTKQHDVTLNGKHVGIPDNVKTFVNMLLDYKYMKDTFK